MTRSNALVIYASAVNLLSGIVQLAANDDLFGLFNVFVGAIVLLFLNDGD